jgi:1-acyl-sn-glycerol-3-phosphate acyltransferase
VNSKYRPLHSTLNALFGMLSKRQVIGLENLPTAGPCVLVFNHVSNFDPPLLFTLIRRRDATGLVADNYRDRPFYRFIVEGSGGTWLKRGASDRAALETALALLNNGWLVGIAPEGRRSPSRSLIEGKPGPAFLALHAGALIVPAGLSNTDQLGPALKQMRRITLTIRFGKPFMLPAPDGRDNKAHLRFCTEMIMCHIAALVPEPYRGVYAHHPELQCLLAESQPA